jgi:hypothetical protein
MRDTIWTTADGRQLLVSQMETGHIQRCIARILRKRNWRRKYLARLRLELTIRSLK